MPSNGELYQSPRWVAGDQPKYWDIMVAKNVKKDTSKTGESINRRESLERIDNMSNIFEIVHHIKKIKNLLRKLLQTIHKYLCNRF